MYMLDAETSPQHVYYGYEGSGNGIAGKTGFSWPNLACWWEGVCWPNRVLLAKRDLLAKRYCRPDRVLLANPGLLVGRGLLAKPGLAGHGPTGFAGHTGLQAKPGFTGRTGFAGTKNQVDSVVSFGASEHDGVFSFPAAPGGAEAYLFRWLASNKHILGCSGHIRTRSSHSNGFVLDRAEPAR